MSYNVGLDNNMLASDKLRQEGRLKMFLIKVGILKVDTNGSGNILAKVASEDAKDFSRLEAEYRKLEELYREKIEIDALVNAKTMYMTGLRAMWWANIKYKYKGVAEASKATGVYFDKKTNCIRQGLSGNGYNDRADKGDKKQDDEVVYDEG